MKLTAIDKAFGVGESTGQGKSMLIRKMLKISLMAWMIQVNGFLVDARFLKREIQEEALRKGMIPYIPERPRATDDESARRALNNNSGSSNGSETCRSIRIQPLWSSAEFALCGLQTFIAVEGKQFGDQFAKVPLNDAVEFVKGQVAAVIGESILGEVIGANAFAAVAGADQCAAGFRAFCSGFVLA
jgi:hypothetical protein